MRRLANIDSVSLFHSMLVMLGVSVALTISFFLCVLGDCPRYLHRKVVRNDEVLSWGQCPQSPSQTFKPDCIEGCYETIEIEIRTPHWVTRQWRLSTVRDRSILVLEDASSETSL